MEGWIKLHRKITEWDWYDDANTFRLFIHLLLKANSKDAKWRGIMIKRGQLITSVSHLADDLKLTNKQIRLSLEKLKKTGEVGNQRANNSTMITINKYEDYQGLDETKGQTKGKGKGKQRANEGQTEGNKQEEEEYKEGKEDINIDIYPFEDFWNDYDKKRGEIEKIKSKWAKLTNQEKELIKLYIPKYKNAQPDKAFRKDPATFLNNKSWNDEIITSKAPSTPKINRLHDSDFN